MFIKQNGVNRMGSVYNRMGSVYNIYNITKFHDKFLTPRI